MQINPTGIVPVGPEMISPRRRSERLSAALTYLRPRREIRRARSIVAGSRPALAAKDSSSASSELEKIKHADKKPGSAAARAQVADIEPGEAHERSRLSWIRGDIGRKPRSPAPAPIPA